MPPLDRGGLHERHALEPRERCCDLVGCLPEPVSRISIEKARVQGAR